MFNRDSHGLLKLVLLVGCVAVTSLAYLYRGLGDLVLSLLTPTLFLSFVLVHLFDRLLKHEVPANIVLKVVLGENLSAEVLQVLRTEVGNEALLRRHATWKFSFREHEMGVSMLQEISSHLVNRSREPRILQLPKAHSSQDVKLRTYTFGAKELSPPKTFSYHEGQLREGVVTIEPHIEYQEELRAEGHYAKPEVSGEHQTRTLIEDLTIVFEYPDRFTLDLYPHFSCPGMRQEPVDLGGGTKRLVQSAKVVLPQQGISFRLFEIPRADGIGQGA